MKISVFTEEYMYQNRVSNYGRDRIDLAAS